MWKQEIAASLCWAMRVKLQVSCILLKATRSPLEVPTIQHGCGMLKQGFVATSQVAIPSVNGLAFSPQGDLLAATSFTKIYLWDVEIGSRRLDLTGHTDEIQCVSYSFQGDLIASGSMDKTVRLWDAELESASIP